MQSYNFITCFKIARLFSLLLMKKDNETNIQIIENGWIKNTAKISFV